MATKTKDKDKDKSNRTAENGILRAAAKDTALHRRILLRINQAVRPEDLLPVGPVAAHAEGAEAPADDHGPMPLDPKEEAAAEKLRGSRLEVAADILKFRDEVYPLGFRHLRELEPAGLFGRRFEDLFAHLWDRFFGSWADFPQDIPRRGPGSYDGVIHAAVCKTGKVLFITADETTLLWDPENTAAGTFENPTNQPHLMPGGYSQLCGHHVFLSNGKLLSVGGGGYGYSSQARAGYVFDPDTRSWARTANDMSEAKWYPTAVALGDERVLVTCGDRGGDMDVYSEATNRFTTVSGDDRGFPNLYPGMHLLPNHAIFYSRTGWGDAGPGGSPYNDSRSAYFTLSGNAGNWTNIQNASANRTKAMSVMLLRNTPPYVRVIVLGGVGGAEGTYEIADVTSISGATSWSAPIPFPDGIGRSLASAVLLPDGNLFVAGGTTSTNTPSAIYNTATGTWTAMASLPSARNYHSLAVLLPSGKVAMAGWANRKIEIFSPPYLFAGSRPTITSAPGTVHHGQDFAITSPEAATITRVVLVRPMAVTHQTDSEQKVIEMPNRHDHASPNRIVVTAPDGGHPHSYAQKGHYMMFALNASGVPSVARWVFLH